VRDTNEPVIRGTFSRPPFRISLLTRYHYSGTKKATFRLEIEGVANIDCDVFQVEGNPPFVRPAAVRDRYSGAWVRRCALDKSLLDEVTEAVCARLEADAVEEPA
jgi:hypothetical protein